MKTSLRYLVRNRGLTIINILGLAIGICIFIHMPVKPSPSGNGYKGITIVFQNILRYFVINGIKNQGKSWTLFTGAILRVFNQILRTKTKCIFC